MTHLLLAFVGAGEVAGDSPGILATGVHAAGGPGTGKLSAQPSVPGGDCLRGVCTSSSSKST